MFCKRLTLQESNWSEDNYEPNLLVSSNYESLNSSGIFMSMPRISCRHVIASAYMAPLHLAVVHSGFSFDNNLLSVLFPQRPSFLLESISRFPSRCSYPVTMCVDGVDSGNPFRAMFWKLNGFLGTSLSASLMNLVFHSFHSFQILGYSKPQNSSCATWRQ
jgi:hypothetical protein